MLSRFRGNRDVRSNSPLIALDDLAQDDHPARVALCKWPMISTAPNAPISRQPHPMAPFPYARRTIGSGDAHPSEAPWAPTADSFGRPSTSQSVIQGLAPHPRTDVVLFE
jgi:hypothetical protein